MSLLAHLYAPAVIGLLGVSAFYLARPRHSETTRPRGKPFDDPGGYAAHGDWPFVPSDLKTSFHASPIKGERQHGRS